MTKEIATKSGKASENPDARESVSGLTISGEGVLSPDQANLANFINAGFSEERVIKIGDPSKGDAVMAYTGELIGPGPDITLNDIAAKDRDQDQKTIPTWCFHPIDARTLKPIYSVTHTIISPHDLNAKCMRLQALKMAHPECRVQAAIIWEGKFENRLGQPLHKYRSAHRLVDKDGNQIKASGANQE